MNPIYLDYAATTPLDLRVREVLWSCLGEFWGNPSSRSHRRGLRAAQKVAQARLQVAAAVGARSPEEIVFTSGATEANNLALKGLLGPGDHVVVGATEHPSVLEVARALEERGTDLTVLMPDWRGRVTPDQVAAALRPQTKLVSLMAVNNETGTCHPLANIGEVTRSAGVWLHCDATQAVGNVAVDVEAMNVDLMSLSGHKLYGPMGIGALYVRRSRPRIPLRPLLHGGGQERQVRAGTSNLPAIVGLGVACQIASNEGPVHARRIRGLRERLWRHLADALPGLVLHGSLDPADSAPGILNVALPVPSAELVAALPSVEVSTGSACASASAKPSHVLDAMGVDKGQARRAVRFSLGRGTTPSDVDRAAAVVSRAIDRCTATSTPSCPRTTR